MRRRVYSFVTLLCIVSIIVNGCGLGTRKHSGSKSKSESKVSKEDDEFEYELSDQDITDLRAIKACTDEIVRLMGEGTKSADQFSEDSDYLTCMDIHRDCANISDDLIKIETKLSKLGNSDDQFVKNAKEASLVLVKDAQGLMSDTSELFLYVYNILDAFYSIEDADFDINSSDDIAEVYYEIESYAEQFSDDTDVPVYLKDSHKNLAKYFNYMNDAMYEFYVAMSLMEQTGRMDNLRLYSASLELDRILPELDKGMGYWLSDFDDEMDSIERRYNNILSFNDEINESIDAALNNMPAKDISRISYEKEVVINYDSIDVIYPALYNREDFLVHLSAYSDYEDTEVVVSVKIEGFTQEYSQKITLTDSMTELYILPPVLAQKIDLSSAKDSQIEISVTDAKNSTVYLKESKKIKIMSQNDVNLYDPLLGDATIHNFLALLTPEASELDTVKRNAISILEESDLNAALIGYQGSRETLIYEVYAILYAIGEMGVRYDTTSFSYSDSNSANQRVKFPVEVLEKKSGLCVETSALLASILKSMNVNCFLIFPPGHCMVAVELGDCTGEYLLVETTALPASNYDINDLFTILSDSEWEYQLSTKGWLAVDCNMAMALNFQTLNN